MQHCSHCFILSDCRWWWWRSV